MPRIVFGISLAASAMLISFICLPARAEDVSSLIAERFQSVKSEIVAVHNTTHMREKVEIILVPPQMIGFGPIAWTHADIFAKKDRVYDVYIDRHFLEEAQPLLLEHVAHHEMCHIINKDFTQAAVKARMGNDMLHFEKAAERCVSLLVGKERYASYIDAYEHWQPKDPKLEEARLQILTTMFRPDN